jgi:hypothetical protein
MKTPAMTFGNDPSLAIQERPTTWTRWAALSPSGWTGIEDLVSTDPAPDDVRLTLAEFVSVLPGGTPVRRPSHFHDGTLAVRESDSLDRLDPEAGPKLPSRNIRYELVPDGVLESLSLPRKELLEVAVEAGSRCESRQ